MNTWDLFKIQLKSKLSADSYQNWISRTEFSHIQEKSLYVTVPNEETRVWLTSEYSNLVESVMREIGLDLSGVVYELAGVPNQRPPASAVREDLFDSTRTPLNPRFTFDSFVVGACNQFAHAAAQSVATAPSRLAVMKRQEDISARPSGSP